MKVFYMSGLCTLNGYRRVVNLSLQREAKIRFLVLDWDIDLHHQVPLRDDSPDGVIQCLNEMIMLIEMAKRKLVV